MDPEVLRYPLMDPEVLNKGFKFSSSVYKIF